MPTIKLRREYLNLWTAAGQNIYHNPGDFYQMTGLYPTLDRQEIRRAPAFSSHLTHADIDTVEGMFFDAANERYVLIGQDSSNDLACTYFSSAWSYVGARYVLDSSVATMDGLSMRNFTYGPENLWVLCDGSIQETDDYVNTALSNWESTECDLITRLSDRHYMAETGSGRLRRTDSDGLFENHFNPVWDLVPLYLCGLKDDLLYVVQYLDGELHVMRTCNYAKTSIRLIEDMAILPGDRGDYPSAGRPFCVHDNDLYLLSGAMDNPDGTETRDLLAYTGYRMEKMARLDDVSASALSLGLFSWRGELIYYELTASSAEFKLLVGNQFIDFASVSSYSASGLAPIADNLGGEIVVVGKSGSDEGIHHAGGAALDDGNVETSYLDGGLPGVKKRLIDVSLHIKNGTSNTTKTISYKKDDQSSYTQIATETDASEQLTDTGLGPEFYRIRFKLALADTSTTQDVRITGFSYTYAVGDE
jgi:hypothetical protein